MGGYRRPDVGGSPGLAAGRAHGREGRGVGRTRGWAAGRPAFAPETVSARFGHFMAFGSGPDRETRCCGPLRAPDGGAMAGSGPEMSPPRHPPSAGPARSRTLQPLGERVNRTCGQSCYVRRRPLCDRREAGPAGTGPAGPPGASQLEAGQPPGLAVLTIQGARRSLHAGLLPLPTQALDRPRSLPGAGPEPQLGPEAECVPTHPNFVRRKAGQDSPRLPLLGVPGRRQGATAFCGGCAESGPAPGTRGIRMGTKARAGSRRPPSAQKVTFFGYLMWGCQPPDRGRGKALRQDLSPQFRTGQGPVAQRTTVISLGTAGARACSSSTIGSIQAPRFPSSQTNFTPYIPLSAPRG